MPTTDIYADTRSRGRCRHASCNAALTWAEIVKTGKKMPFNGEPVALRTRHEGGRLVEEVDLDDNHWKDCPGQNGFRRSR